MNSLDKLEALKKEIGSKLRKARNAQGISLEELAARSGRDWSYICQIELGKCNPSIKTLHLLCEQVKIPIYSLFNKTTVEPSTNKSDPFLNKIGYYLKNASTKDKKTAVDVIKKLFK